MPLEALIGIVLTASALLGGVVVWGARRLIVLGEKRNELKMLQEGQNALERQAEAAAQARFEEKVGRDQTREAVARVDGRTERIESGMHSQDKQLAVIEENGKLITRRLDELDAKVDDHGQRISVLEAKP